MKKIIVTMLVLWSLHSVCTDYGAESQCNDTAVTSCHNQTEEYQSYHNNEYENQFDSENEEIADYEQHICDHIKPQKPSSINAILTNIGCTVLIHYIALREKTKIYLAYLKNTIAKWFYAYA